nr:hypothetical protein HmN_000223800 [Hymenolepis microstoma]
MCRKRPGFECACKSCKLTYEKFWPMDECHVTNSVNTVALRYTLEPLVSGDKIKKDPAWRREFYHLSEARNLGYEGSDLGQLKKDETPGFSPYLRVTRLYTISYSGFGQKYEAPLSTHLSTISIKATGQNILRCSSHDDLNGVADGFKD